MAARHLRDAVRDQALASIGREISLTFAREGASVAANEGDTKERRTNSCQGGTNAFHAQDSVGHQAGREADFRTNQEALCKVMLEHPGVICYHADYPSQRVSQWTRSMQPTRRSQRISPTTKARVRWQQSLTRATKLRVNAGGIQTPAPKKSSPVLGRPTTIRPQTLSSSIRRPIGTRGSSEIRGRSNLG